MGSGQAIRYKKIAHEAPLALMPMVSSMTDYEYALVHLFEESSDYFKFFKKALKEGREVILDNSLYELGEAFDTEKYASWIKKLKPTEYIIPDVLGDSDGTVKEAEEWMKKYSDLPGKKIGVVHGHDFYEMVDCYNGLVNAGVDKIAFTFRGSAYESIIGGTSSSESIKLASWALGRIAVLERMIEECVIEESLPHHLLGCSIPTEFTHYKDPRFNWIESIDTSNPVTLAMEDYRYDAGGGVSFKPSIIIAEEMFEPVGQWKNVHVRLNIGEFKKLVNG